MNRLLTVATIATMLVSCVKVGVVEPEVAPEEMSAIEFGAFVDKSSRAVETTTSTIAAAKVCAFYSRTDDWSTSTSRVQYMDAELSIDGVSNVITCSPTSYWPGIAAGDDNYGKLSFFSYSPIDDACVLSQAVGSQNIALEYSVDDDPAAQSDLVFAAELDRTQGDVNPSVSLAYNHILSKISFSAFSYSTGNVIKSIKVKYSDDSSKYIASKGTYTHDVVGGAHSWASADVASHHHSGTTPDLSPDVDVALSEDPQEIVSSENYMMVMPQSVVDGAISVEVVYNNGAEDVTKECALPAPSEGEFEMGIHYNYALEVDNSNIVITDIIINPWDAMEEVRPFNIYTAEQLASIGHDPLYVNNGCYMIMNDIDVSDYINRRCNGSWKPLCGDDPFTGEIVGQGFTISGITITEAEGTNQGLFAKVDGANIHDLNIGTPNISGGTNVGGLAGSITNGTTIKDCSTVGGIVSGSSKVGGLVGVAEGSVVSYSHNASLVSAKVDSNSAIAGGIVGEAKGASTVLACYNQGEITGVQTIGGIAGSVASSKLVTCYNTANVTGYDPAGAIKAVGATRFFAGIAGQSTSSKYVSCYNTGRIKWARYADVASGIIGKNGGSNTLIESYHLRGSAKRKISTSKTLHSDAGFRTLDQLNDLITAMNEKASEEGYGGYSRSGNIDYLPYTVMNDPRISMTEFIYESGYEPIFDHYDIFKMSNLSGKYQVMNDIYAQCNVADVDAGVSVPIEPIGKSNTSAAHFKGAFNGDGFTLYELKMDKTWGAAVSLFGYVNSPYTRAIENYNISNPYILIKDGTNVYYAAGFVGVLFGGNITNCHVTGNAGHIECYDDTSGGIVAYCDSANSEIKNCSNSAYVKADNYVGGIVGKAKYFKSISGCVNSGRIEVGTSYVGGILGETINPEGKKPGDIINCGNHGEIKGQNNYAGGIVGRYNYNNYRCTSDTGYEDGLYTLKDIMGHIKGCYNSSKGSTSIHDDYTGGIAGGASAVFIDGCYNDGEVKTDNTKGDWTKCKAAGIVGDTDYSFISCCYNNGYINHSGQTTLNQNGGIAAYGNNTDFYGCYNSGLIRYTSSGSTGAIVGSGTNELTHSSCFYVDGTFAKAGSGIKVNDLNALNAKIGTMNSVSISYSYVIKEYEFVKGATGMLPYIRRKSDGSIVGEQIKYVKH